MLRRILLIFLAFFILIIIAIAGGPSLIRVFYNPVYPAWSFMIDGSLAIVLIGVVMAIRATKHRQ